MSHLQVWYDRKLVELDEAGMQQVITDAQSTTHNTAFVLALALTLEKNYPKQVHWCKCLHTSRHWPCTTVIYRVPNTLSPRFLAHFSIFPTLHGFFLASADSHSA